MSNIDYSKWDKIELSDDDDDDDQASYAKVTKLDAPSKVTFSSDGFTVQKDTSVLSNEIKKRSPTSDPKLSEESRDLSYHEMKKKNRSCDEIEASRIQYLTKNGGIYKDINPPCCTAYWCQDRNEAIVSISYDSTSIKSSDIRVELSGALKYADRHSAVSVGSSSLNGRLNVYDSCKGITLFQGNFAYPIHLAEGEEQGDVEWEIDVTDANHKLIRITLYKAVPMMGVTLWWKKPFVHFDDIDVVTGVEGRTNVGNDGSHHHEWKKTWEDAHEMFKEQIKNRERQIIDDD